MSEIKLYEKMRRGRREIENWVAMLGREYSGGGGGIGEIKYIISGPNKTPTIYYQAYSGAPKYHEMPAALALYLEESLKSHFREILKTALESHAGEMQIVASRALVEHQNLLEAAGLGSQS